MLLSITIINKTEAALLYAACGDIDAAFEACSKVSCVI